MGHALLIANPLQQSRLEWDYFRALAFPEKQRLHTGIVRPPWLGCKSRHTGNHMRFLHPRQEALVFSNGDSG